MLNKRDTFVILPTGYGKSIIYGVLPMTFDFMRGKSKLWQQSYQRQLNNTGVKGSIAVVITPLTALMLDQKERFIQTGLTVEFVGSAQDDGDATEAVLSGKVQLVYISPESVLNNKKFRGMFLREMYQENLVALVVDEAHCVKLW